MTLNVAFLEMFPMTSEGVDNLVVDEGVVRVVEVVEVVVVVVVGGAVVVVVGTVVVDVVGIVVVSVVVVGDTLFVIPLIPGEGSKWGLEAEDDSLVVGQDM